MLRSGNARLCRERVQHDLRSMLHGLSVYLKSWNVRISKNIFNIQWLTLAFGGKSLTQSQLSVKLRSILHDHSVYLKSWNVRIIQVNTQCSSTLWSYNMPLLLVSFGTVRVNFVHGSFLCPCISIVPPSATTITFPPISIPKWSRPLYSCLLPVCHNNSV